MANAAFHARDPSNSARQRAIAPDSDDDVFAHPPPSDDVDFPESARAWGVLEQLAGDFPASGSEALKKVQPLLDRLASDGALRESIIKAMRTEEPRHFMFDEVRAKVIEALMPSGRETLIRRVFMEELESHPNNEQACNAALNAINTCGRIKDNDLTNRVVDLILQQRSNPEYSALLPRLKPHVEGGVSSKRVSELGDIAKDLYRNDAQCSPAILNALGMTRHPAAAETLRAIALNQVYTPYSHWKAFWTSLAAVGISTLAGMGIGGVSAAEPGGMSGAAGAWLGAYILGGIGAAISSIAWPADAHNSRKDRKYKSNNTVALAALDGLALCAAQSSALKTLDELSTTGTADEPVHAAAIKSLREAHLSLQEYELGGCFSHKNPALRFAALKNAELMNDNWSEKQARKLTEDRDDDVRKLAYHLLDSIAARKEAKEHASG